MSMAPWTYTDARIDSRYHVQVKLLRMVIGQTPSEVPLHGIVVRVFRGGENLNVGSEIQFSVDVISNKDEPRFGDEVWQVKESIEKAKYMEAFLDGNPPQCKVAAWQSFIINAPSDTPQIDVPSERGDRNPGLGKSITIDELLSKNE
jgi:hypothetical protein